MIPLNKSISNKETNPILPIKPVSSAIAVNIKSEWERGTRFGYPKPIPVPNRPPAANEMID